MKDSTSKGSIVVLTTSFPTQESLGGNFVKELTYRLTEQYDITVLAPLVEESNKEEHHERYRVTRYEVSPFGNRGLCQGSGIFSNIKKKPWLFLLTPFLIFNQVKALRKLISKGEDSIIHAHWLMPSGISAVLYKVVFNKNIRILVTSHGSDLYKFNFFPIKFIKKRSLKYINEITVVSENMKEYLIKLGYKKDIKVIPMGIDTQKFVPKKRNEETKVYKLIYVGTLIKTKGVLEIIQALGELINKKLNVSLSIVGKGNIHNQLISLVSAKSLNEYVKFYGSVPNEELPELYNSHDLFILPSHSEGFPVALSEALSCGLISITSDIPVFKSIAKNNNFLVTSEVENSRDLAEKIYNTLMWSSKEKNLAQKQAREFAVQNLDWKQVVKKYTFIINDCINTNTTK